MVVGIVIHLVKKALDARLRRAADLEESWHDHLLHNLSTTRTTTHELIETFIPFAISLLSATMLLLLWQEKATPPRNLNAQESSSCYLHLDPPPFCPLRMFHSPGYVWLNMLRCWNGLSLFHYFWPPNNASAFICNLGAMLLYPTCAAMNGGQIAARSRVWPVLDPST